MASSASRRSRMAGYLGRYQHLDRWHTRDPDTMEISEWGGGRSMARIEDRERILRGQAVAGVIWAMDRIFFRPT